MMVEPDAYDPRNLLVPIEGRAGAIVRVESLIAEMSHPNIDWKHVVAGIRSYLFDHIHDISPHADTVLPVIFHYLREATLRKKGSTLRAGETFFDRYLFVLTAIAEGRAELGPIALRFHEFARDYLDLMKRESADGYYFEGVNERVCRVGGVLAANSGAGDGILDLVSDLLVGQLALHAERSVSARDVEVENLRAALGRDAGTAELFELLEKVSQRRKREDVLLAARPNAGSAAERFARIASVADFSRNTRTWERICAVGRGLVERGSVSSEEGVLALLAFLIRRAQEGDDRDLQLFISRSVASFCGALDGSGRGSLLKSVVDMVMPLLLREVESDGSYYSAFATIYTIGKTVVESGRVSLIDHFVDILIQSRFRFPEFSGIASDWSVIVNSSHLENIRTWMRLIEIDPPVMKKLAAGLIVNLKLGGVFLKDTDVFQRDISQLLNSDYKDVFHLITSLAAVFPAFYHDIGATGDIRSFTEKIDTNHRMNDLVHFLRKQVHVESSSRTVLLIQRIMEFWMTGEGRLLEGLVPAEVYDTLPRAWRLINLDNEPAAQALFEAARRHFSEVADGHFWDFLGAVGKKRFIEFAAVAAMQGVSDAERTDAIGCFEEYFDTRFPAEMTKMLHFIKNMFDIDTSKTKIWKFLYDISDEEFRKMFENVRFLDISRVNIEKFITFLHVYRMIFDKYNFSKVRDVEKLEAYAREGLFAPPEDLFEALRGSDPYAALGALLDLQYSLKWDILLSGKVFEPLDTIEFKRHIAFGIPSMYGSYKEKKFDTLKVFFHCNLIRERLFESMVETCSVFSGRALDFGETRRVMRLFGRTFEIDGLSGQEMRSVLSLMDAPNLRLSQFRDIVTSLFTIHGEVSDHFNEMYKYVCTAIINNIGAGRIVEDYLPGEGRGSADVIADRFLRSQIMLSPLLQLFDNMLIRLRERMDQALGRGDDSVCLNACDVRRAKGDIFFPIGKYPGRHSYSELFVPLWLAGGKAQGLVIAANMESISVPEGIVLSAELYKRLREGDVRNPRFQRKIIFSLRQYVDRLTDGRFGNPSNPVLLSVRSGGVFSMPGVMDTITNVGITQDVIDYYARQDPWFAYDCYRRLIHDFALSYYGMDRALYERLMTQAKEEAAVDLKEKLTGRQMEILTKKYRYAINRAGFSVPKDHYEQLYHAIVAVYQSWNSPVARNYRQFVNMSDEWGTAVIVQKMVFGNNSPNSITGVVHSHYLGYENIGLFGEYKTRAQGHDIVSGVARVFPISEQQRSTYTASSPFSSMERSYPEQYRKVYDAVKRIRERWGNEVEIEFTLENDTLYILQIRGITNHIFETDELDEGPLALLEYLLGKGLAASGGAVCGRAVFDIDRIDIIRKRFKGDKIILVRPETNPEDVIGIKKSEGILTSVGGMTSHAVLQMRRLEKSGVSDFSVMRVDEGANRAVVNLEAQGKGRFVIAEGDFLTIDGSTGHVYSGFHATVKKRL
ncbi:MAG TPA: PEP/pyruvate-binding domain-containing protein [Spirochaetota bacterium]|nr:PEP/pyruvate-binding domain-containing protein [Spirochaetota bacterium]